jgi:transcriptional regulator with XRE-family HTH domain
MHEQRSPERSEDIARLDGAILGLLASPVEQHPLSVVEAAREADPREGHDDLEVSVSLPPPSVFWRAGGAELGAVIRARRMALDVSIEALAGEAGMHPTYLSIIERGRGNPTWDRISDLAEALGVPASVLACEAEGCRIEQALHAAAASAYRLACARHGHADHRGQTCQWR